MRPSLIAHLRPVFALALLLGSACAGPPRDLPSHTEMHARAVSNAPQHAEQDEDLVQRTLARMRAEHASAAPDEAPIFDILMLSGGGQFGAFGAGVLRGWGAAPGREHRRPHLDLVTGVSTGSLVSPFAFAGTDEEFERIEDFYREVRPDFAVLRGMLFFLPWRESFFDVTGLQQTLDEKIGSAELAALRAGHAEHRTLLVATTDIDLGTLRIWHLGEEVHGLSDDEQALDRLRRILQASSSIPAALPPVALDGGLHVDGGVSESIFLPTHVLEALPEAVRLDPDLQHPRVRVWAIVNGKLSAGFQATRPIWPAIAGRSTGILSDFATANELRRVELLCRWLDAVGPLEVEFRYIALPEEFEVPETKLESIFDAELMARLAALGEELGRDPSAWHAGTPRPEQLSPLPEE